jgi:hypothetical protein
MLEKLKNYTAKHRLDDEADKNVLICTKIAVNLSNDIIGIIKEKEFEYKLFSCEEIDKIEQALNENKDKTKIYRTKDGQHYALEPILNDGSYCTEKECDVAGIYSIPEKIEIVIFCGRQILDGDINLMNNKGEPAIAIYNATRNGYKLSEVIELNKVQSDEVKYKKTMKDIEKDLNENKENDKEKHINDKEQINKINEFLNNRDLDR